MPGKRIRYTQVPNGIVTFDLLFPAVLLLPLLIIHLLRRGQGGRALNYQLSTGPPTKSNRNYEPVTRPGGLVRPPFPPPSHAPPALPAVRRFISYVHADEEQCENWGSVSPGCWHSSYSRGGTHLGATRRGAARRGSIPERSGLSEPAGRSER